MNKNILFLVVVAVVAIGGYLALRGNNQQSSKEETPSSEGSATIVDKEFIVEGKEYNFNPSSITVSAGDQVRITFKNAGDAAHNFVIQDLNVSTRTIHPGQTDTIEFTAPSSGTYAFLCSVPGHAVAGMLGDLLVK